MRGENNDLVITTSFDEATGTEVPLLHFPVQIAKATGSVDTKFDAAAPSGAEYETQYVDKATGEVFEFADRQRGVRAGPDQFAAIPEEEIANIEAATKLVDMRVEKVEDYDDIPFDRAVGLYFLQVPQKSGAHKVYNLIYRALLPQKGKTKAAKRRLALRVKFSQKTRQKLGVVYADPERGCLMMNVLTFAADLREPDEAILAHQQAQVEEVQVAKARKVLEALVSPIDPKTKEPRDVGGWDAPSDEAIEQRRKLVEQAAAGESIVVAPTPDAEVVQTDQVTDLLEASLAGAGAE